MSLEGRTPELNRGSGDKTAKSVPVDENTYNNVVGGVGYMCLFLLISTDNFNNCWGKVSLIFGGPLEPLLFFRCFWMDFCDSIQALVIATATNVKRCLTT